MSEDEEAPNHNAERKDRLAYERGIFKDWLADTAKRPPEEEYIRRQETLRYLTQILNSPYVTQEECFATVYGPAGPAGFWAIECSEPVKWLHAIRLFAVMLAQDEHQLRQLPGLVGSQFVDAFQSGADWFLGDTSPLQHARHGWQVRPSDSLKVDVRRAAEWLLSKPKRRQWVPASLAAFVRSSPQAASTPGPEDTGRRRNLAGREPKHHPRRLNV